MKPLNNQIRKVSTLVFSILCIVACENDSSIFNESNGDAIAFETSNNWNLVEKTRGLYENQEIMIEDGSQIGVFGYVMPNNAALAERPTSGTAADFFRNQMVTYNSSSNAWVYSPIKYWPHQNKLYLCGYYPYNNAELDNEKVKWELNGEQVVLSAEQAYPTQGSTIHFEMKHRMQLIRFRFVSPQMVYSQISRIEFNSMPQYAYLDPTNNEFYGETSTTYTFTNDKGNDGEGSGVETDFNIYQEVNDITEYYFVVPTKMKIGDAVTTINTFAGTIYFHDETESDKLKSQTFSVTIDDDKIVEGGTHLITFNLRDDFVDNSAVTFEESNCYMINPLTTDAQQRYRIPISRVFDFWKNYTSTPLGETEEWIAEVIWQDVNTQQFEFVTDETSGSTTINKGQFKGKGSGAYISFKPKKGAAGNVLIGIRRNKTGWSYQTDGYLWTFHLWFTDYNPTYSMPWQENKYIYDVKGGEVHRYPSSDKYNLWKAGGEYDQKYIMDRNLGARDAGLPNATANDNKQYNIPGVLGYQFGRPAPMPSSGAPLWVMKTDGTITQYTKLKTSGTDKNPNGNMEALDQQATMVEAIKHPCTLYIRPGATETVTTSWCSQASDYIGNIWHDKSTNANDTKKSIFDPSPQGWKLPKSGTWNGFIQLPYGGNRDFVWTNSANSNEKIHFYAICIAQNRTSGATSYEEDPGANGSRLNGGLYVATRFNNANAQSLEMMTGVFSDPNSQLDSFGESIRCVQE